jgi:peptidoglycan/LPS O-acetylase OafA/YrhL
MMSSSQKQNSHNSAALESIVTPGDTPKKLASIQVLRGLAAVLVVHAHAVDAQIGLGIGQSIYQQWFFLENFGAVGVDIFFVISGFIMTLTAKKFLRSNGFQDFLANSLLLVVNDLFCANVAFFRSTKFWQDKRLSISQLFTYFSRWKVFSANSFYRLDSFI